MSRFLSPAFCAASLTWCWCLPRQSLINFVRVYRLLLSPWLGACCRFEPTCSTYALQALETRGAFVGTYLTLHRLVRCNPWCAGGHDPVCPSRQPGAGQFLSSLIRRLNPHSSSEKTSS